MGHVNLVPNRKVPGLVGVFRNRGGLGTSKPYVPIVFFYPFMHQSPCSPTIHTTMNNHIFTNENFHSIHEICYPLPVGQSVLPAAHGSWCWAAAVAAT